MLSQISSTIPINPLYQFDPIEISGIRPSVAALQRRIPPRWQSAAWRGLYNPQWPLVFGINQWMEWGIPFSNKSWWMWWYFWRGLILIIQFPARGMLVTFEFTHISRPFSRKVSLPLLRNLLLSQNDAFMQAWFTLFYALFCTSNSYTITYHLALYCT